MSPKAEISAWTMFTGKKVVEVRKVELGSETIPGATNIEQVELVLEDGQVAEGTYLRGVKR